MNIFALSQPSLRAGALLLHVMLSHGERTLCYCPSTRFGRPCPPRGFDTLCHGKALGHPMAGSHVGLTKQ